MIFEQSTDSQKRFGTAIVNLIKDRLPTDPRGSPIPAEIQVACALRCWARHEIQDDTADLHGISQPTVSKVCKNVAEALAKLRHQFIKMPSTLQEEEQGMARFRSIANFPQVIGAIDCTHIRVKKCNAEDGLMYINRKGYASINCQRKDITELNPYPKHHRKVFWSVEAKISLSVEGTMREDIIPEVFDDNLTSQEASIPLRDQRQQNSVRGNLRRRQLIEKFLEELAETQRRVGGVLEAGARLLEEGGLTREEAAEVRLQARLLAQRWEATRCAAVQKQVRIRQQKNNC
ncbi:hypothetical protein ACJJTC_014553 [Scirpophaga incertulas]